MKSIHNKTTSCDCRTIALAGNPNVGKSTLFNQFTGLNQHTGNWPGKTVTVAQGTYLFEDTTYNFVDLPGTYSLFAHSEEEETARDFICFGNADVVAVVCDATCLERNLNLVLQIMEVTERVVVCVNLLDEAEKNGIKIDLVKLQERLGVPVAGTSARNKKGLHTFMDQIKLVCNTTCPASMALHYSPPVEEAISIMETAILPLQCHIFSNTKFSTRWLALKLLDYNKSFYESMKKYSDYSLLRQEPIKNALLDSYCVLVQHGISRDYLQENIVTSLVSTSQTICKDVVVEGDNLISARNAKLDKILTSKLTGIPIMLLLLCTIFWLTITAANYPSALLSQGFFWFEDRLTQLCMFLHVPDFIHGALILGVYRTLAWVVSVMLPPMAIFFPLFTLLEDLGYLPRIAFNLDHHFNKAHACGKQALTMCMGFGCNAAGVTGCRIIDSKRERLIAILTNNFVPCNGRFPTLIAIITMFFAGLLSTPYQSVMSSLLLCSVIILGIILTFLVSRLLSGTVLKGIPSSFTLELPPYRKPQIGQVILRSLLDRTLFVLGRAVLVAAPAGLVIWLMANLRIGDASLLAISSGFLDPFAKLLGLDGVILLAFILGFPANEIVVPIIIMAYLSTGSIVDIENLHELKSLFVSHGWTSITAISTMLFCLMHWPCSTTCLTIKKETGSFKWTLISFLLPTIIGIIVCFIFANTARLFIK